MNRSDEKELLRMKDTFIAAIGDGTVSRDFYKGKAAGIAFTLRYLIDADLTREESDATQ